MNVSKSKDDDINNNMKNKNKNDIKQKTSEKAYNPSKTKTNDLIPVTILTANIIQNNKCDKPLLVLLDSGSINSFIKYFR